MSHGENSVVIGGHSNSDIDTVYVKCPDPMNRKTLQSKRNAVIEILAQLDKSADVTTSAIVQALTRYMKYEEAVSLSTMTVEMRMVFVNKMPGLDNPEAPKKKWKPNR